ncbi:hypothetical protein [Salmonirosea aquatica]|uniref:Uncharacterized protein n=1 Tax=Salmonirosea aquatica TaxID=2654236 RepID=A0A7C9FBR7_9BACT|nr:hypothetical protein [Cytophagaceae bacterium SJW1-29]
MNLDDIRFFSPQENKAERKTRTKEETDAPATGYISATGKVIIPQKAAEQVGLNSEHTTYMVGTQQNKRKLKSLYIIPASGHVEGAFEMQSSGRNNFIALGVILEKSGLDYQNNKYTFDINSFVYGDDIKGVELKLNKPTPKAKRAGRKPKNVDL